MLGGCTNSVYLLQTLKNNFVLKTNSATKFPGIFDSERLGLLELSKSEVISIAKPIKSGVFKNLAYLVLQHIKKGKSTQIFWEKLGTQLNSLHKQTNQKFGLDSSNYIGNLVQRNKQSESWPEFFATQRLEVQLKLARDKGYLKGFIGKFEQLYNKLDGLFPKEQPSLLHGDLWTGNVISDDKNMPWLIDPAAYYGHREMDIGMTMLFDGFNKRFYETYNASNPLESDWIKRVPITQLYPLLIHLNLFGASYLSPIKKVIKTFT